jgi:hypothetical protein
MQHRAPRRAWNQPRTTAAAVFRVTTHDVHVRQEPSVARAGHQHALQLARAKLARQAQLAAEEVQEVQHRGHLPHALHRAHLRLDGFRAELAAQHLVGGGGEHLGARVVLARRVAVGIAARVAVGRGVAVGGAGLLRGRCHLLRLLLALLLDGRRGIAAAAAALAVALGAAPAVGRGALPLGIPLAPPGIGVGAERRVSVGAVAALARLLLLVRFQVGGVAAGRGDGAAGQRPLPAGRPRPRGEQGGAAVCVRGVCHRVLCCVSGVRSRCRPSSRARAGR